jgi:polysaccharide export outer membrane protein
MAIYRIARIAPALLAAALTAWPQTAPAPAPVPDIVPAPRATYTLGPDDTISIRVVDAEEVSDRGLRIPPSGSINLPLVGRLEIAGKTVEGVEKELTTRLKPYIRNPEVTVNIVELRSQPISVIGSVNTSGVQQLQGRKTLVEVLSSAGGVRTDAGYSVKITRQKEWGAIPLPGAADDPSGKFSVAEVNLRDITDAKRPDMNILVMPNDVISVPKGEMIYVVGDVKRAGGYVLSDTSHMSVLQAVSMGGGLEKSAASSKAKILRASAAYDKRTEISVNLKNILAGKDKDVPMQAEDILFVPGSKSKTATLRAIDSILQIGTALAIYRF